MIRYVDTDILRMEDQFDEYLVRFAGLVGDCKHIAFKASKEDLELMRGQIDRVLEE